MLDILTLKLVTSTLGKSFKPIWASVPSCEKRLPSGFLKIRSHIWKCSLWTLSTFENKSILLPSSRCVNLSWELQKKIVEITSFGAQEATSVEDLEDFLTWKGQWQKMFLWVAVSHGSVQIFWQNQPKHRHLGSRGLACKIWICSLPSQICAEVLLRCVICLFSPFLTSW